MNQQATAYHEAFQQVLDQLNPAQQEAVAHIEGPVLVIAGPGTGKTHILAARIGHILLATDTPAQSILCLTFTDAGVRAMRQRLLELIGPEAHRVPIYTFHSFCNTVIQDNLAYFGRQGLEPISELEQIALNRRLLDQLDPQNPLRRGKVQPYFYEKHLRDLFQVMKTEDWTPNYLQRAIQVYLDELPQRPEFRYQRKSGNNRAGDVKENSILLATQRMETLAAAVALFPAYEQELARIKRYDYADMILWVLTAFQENLPLLRNYQEQFLYFLVDEYQDTNGAQNELLRLLTSFWDTPNLFIVGDDDQSIFEFQGARLKNLVDYYEQYQDQLKVVLLQQNYRSTQAILDAARRLIGHNEQRITLKLHHLGIEKNLRAALPQRIHSKVVPRLRVYPNPFQEEVAILREIQAQHAAGLAWNEMAVIYARHQQVQSLQLMLDKQGIPYQTRRKTNILDAILIRQLREMLLYLRDEQQRPFSGDHRLFKILHFRCFRLLPLDLAQLAATLAQLPYAERAPWRSWLQQPQRWPAGVTQPAAIGEVGQWWEATHALAANSGLPELVERLLNGSGLLRAALQAPDRLWQVQLAKTFLDFVREEVSRQPRLGLADLLLILDQMDSNRLTLAMRKDIELEDGVQLVTAHGSKGLEFHTVFVLDATQESWEKNGRRGNQFALPDTLTLSGETFVDETRRRLFYVAMTRAKEQLFISYAHTNAKGKDQQACSFLDELTAGTNWPREEIQLPTDMLLAYEVEFLQNTTLPQLPAMERSAVRKMLENFQLSPSSWLRYLTCPISFFYEVVLQAPQIQRAAASYGQAMHHALQRYFNQLLTQTERQFPPAAVLVELFTEEMLQARTYFNSAEFAVRLEQGQRNLQRYYDQFHSTWTTQVRTEMYIQQVEVAGVPIKGVIDRVDLMDERTVQIVDYKTGSHNPTQLRPPTTTNPLGGNYWRQLVFYKLLWENKGGENRSVNTAAISYLDINKEGLLTMENLDFSPEAIRQVTGMLKDSYAKIMAQDFYTGCGEPDCEWCRFVQDDLQPPTFSKPEVEAVDDL
ncbi:MAG: ATP-dependent helicase [Bacteroidetes bacterium]|nr:MAG: ATP-dependent helicase [Bacteroidota bacterium]